MTDYIDHSLQPLAGKLRARYPGIRIVEANLRDVDGTPQQTIRYQAPLATLQHAGLVEPQMLNGTWCSVTSLGDWFHLCDGLDTESRPGCWDLMIFTGTYPRDYRRVGVYLARRVLKRIGRRAQ